MATRPDIPRPYASDARTSLASPRPRVRYVPSATGAPPSR